MRRYDILLIADEVVCRIRQAGQALRVPVPGNGALITVGKGITSSYLPLSAAIIGSKVWNVLEQHRSRLEKTFEGHRDLAEVRGVGFLAAIEFAEDPAQRTRFDADRHVGLKIASACIEEGVLGRALPHGDVVGFAPPLIATRDELDDVIARVSQALDRVTPQLA